MLLPHTHSVYSGHSDWHCSICWHHYLPQQSDWCVIWMCISVAAALVIGWWCGADGLDSLTFQYHYRSTPTGGKPRKATLSVHCIYPTARTARSLKSSFLTVRHSPGSQLELITELDLFWLIVLLTGQSTAPPPPSILELRQDWGGNMVCVSQMNPMATQRFQKCFQMRIGAGLSCL